MSITNQINKASSLASLRQPQRDKDGQIIKGSIWGTDISRTDYVQMTNGQDAQVLNVGFTDRSGRPMAFGNDSHDFVQALEDSLDETFNDGDFRTAVMENVFPCEFRP
ncbi:hypothetical protein I2630_004563, partial [Salmonella enterica]|nr:hypothetical protein [Salmonella enterica]